MNKAQRQALLNKLKTSWGKVKGWSKDKFSKLDDLLTNLDVEDLKEMSKEYLEVGSEIKIDSICQGYREVQPRKISFF